jgi:hypothetical protein
MAQDDPRIDSTALDLLIFLLHKVDKRKGIGRYKLHERFYEKKTYKPEFPSRNTLYYEHKKLTPSGLWNKVVRLVELGYIQKFSCKRYSIFLAPGQVFHEPKSFRRRKPNRQKPLELFKKTEEKDEVVKKSDTLSSKISISQISKDICSIPALTKVKSGSNLFLSSKEKDQSVPSPLRSAFKERDQKRSKGVPVRSNAFSCEALNECRGPPPHPEAETLNLTRRENVKLRPATT